MHRRQLSYVYFYTDVRELPDWSKERAWSSLRAFLRATLSLMWEVLVDLMLQAILVSLIGCSKLPTGVSVSERGCVSECVRDR